MSLLASVILAASSPAPAAVPAVEPGLLPPLACRVVTRSGELLEMAIKPAKLGKMPGFVFEGFAKDKEGLAEAFGLYAQETPGEWEYLLVRDEILIGRVRLVRQGNLRNITFFGAPPGTEIVAGFGFCSEQPIKPTENAPVTNGDFLFAKGWKSGCAFVSPLEPGLIAFDRKTMMSSEGPMIVLTTPDGKGYNAKGGTRLIFVAGAKDHGNTVAADRFEDVTEAGARGMSASYADPTRKLGSQIIKLNRHALGAGSLYGLCSLSVSPMADGVVLKD
jgi:hypothetical protein